MVLPAPGGATRTAASLRAQGSGQFRQRRIDGKGRACAFIRGTLPVRGAYIACVDPSTQWRISREDSVNSAAESVAKPSPASVKSGGMPAKAAPSATSAPPVHARPPKKGDHVFLVDGSSYIFRAYSRAAAAQPQVGRAAGQCRARLLQHAVEADARHEAGGAADPPRGRVRQIGEDVPHRHVSRLQGEPNGTAGRSSPAISLHPRRGARLRPALPGAGGLRGRRPDRDLCAPGLRGGRDARPSSPPTRT